MGGLLLPPVTVLIPTLNQFRDQISPLADPKDCKIAFGRNLHSNYFV